MAKKVKLPEITQEWVLARLGPINAAWLEREAGLTKLRMVDAKRGTKLNPDEMERIESVILGLFLG